MILCVIQAREGSTRFPNKVMQTVGGVPMVKRVWNAAKACTFIDKVVVAWPERYPDIEEDDVLSRFRKVAGEFKADVIIRLTADCPLLTASDIETAWSEFVGRNWSYYSNHKDGYDVQIFTYEYLLRPVFTDREHVINDFSTESTGLSVNTKEDLERVRAICKGK